MEKKNGEMYVTVTTLFVAFYIFDNIFNTGEIITPDDVCNLHQSLNYTYYQIEEQQLDDLFNFKFVMLWKQI